MKRLARCLGLALGLALTWRDARADSIAMPAAPERTGPVPVTYRMDAPATGRGTLQFEWTDADGRLVERRAIPVAPDHAADLRFTLDLRRAVAMSNRLDVHVRLDGQGDRHAATSFIARPPAGWTDEQIVVWQPQTEAQYAALKQIGISAGMVFARRDDPPAGPAVGSADALLREDLRWYVENIATDFYSSYHVWTPGRPLDWRFQDAKRLYRLDPSDPAAFLRSPGLSDPAWLARIRDRLGRVVREEAPYRPLYYSLGDETGIAELAANWDFDLSPDSLRGMRAWLRGQYGTLDRLNAEWGSRYARWDEVAPMTTDEAMRRDDGNYAAWNDFKSWMDEAFARALRAGADAVHAADPTALAAIEGAQVPGWGGYDYTRLVRAVDLMEIYDAGDNVGIVRSLRPEVKLVSTSYDSPTEAHHVWQTLLRGSRGTLLWDDGHTLANPDGTLGPRGARDAALFRELRGGIAALLINSARRADPVAMLYSPASLRAQWMLDQKPRGAAWVERGAEQEDGPNAARTATTRLSALIEHLGVQHRFISPEMLTHGALRGARLLLLPHIHALSRAEAEAIRGFVARGGVVAADTVPGAFDGHLRRLPRPLLSDIFAAAPGGERRYGRGRTIRLGEDEPSPLDAASLRGMRGLLAAAGARPAFALSGADGAPVADIQFYAFRNGGVTLLALQRDLLADGAAATGNEEVVLTLPRPAAITDVRTGAALGWKSHLSLRVLPQEPVVLALSEAAPPGFGMNAPAHVVAGGTARIGFHRQERDGAAAPVLHVDVLDPSGRVVPWYSGNLILRGGAGSWAIPFAANDPAGAWSIQATDLLTGRTRRVALRVAAP